MVRGLRISWSEIRIIREPTSSRTSSRARLPLLGLGRRSAFKNAANDILQRTPRTLFKRHHFTLTATVTRAVALPRARDVERLRLHAYAGTQATHYVGTQTQDRGASRSEIHANFFVRAARFIRSNTPASVSLGDAGGYAVTLRGTLVRHSKVRN